VITRGERKVTNMAFARKDLPATVLTALDVIEEITGRRRAEQLGLSATPRHVPSDYLPDENEGAFTPDFSALSS